MSLRRALEALPDDRETAATVREVVAYFEMHRAEAVDVERIGRATGMSAARVEPVLSALSRARVVSCDGDPRLRPCRFAPEPVLALEVERYLRTGGAQAHLRKGAERFRNRYSGDR